MGRVQGFIGYGKELKFLGCGKGLGHNVHLMLLGNSFKSVVASIQGPDTN